MPAHIHPTSSGYTHGVVPSQRIISPALCPGSHLEPPSAQSPFARSGCYLRRSSVIALLEGHYSFVIAPTNSCARPQRSCHLRQSFIWQVFADRRQSLLRCGPSRHYLCESFLGCLDPYPDGLQSAFACYFLCIFGLPQRVMGRLNRIVR